MNKYRVSAVSYTNTLPFLSGIHHSEIMHEIELSLDYPSECARKVMEDEADLGIIPIAALANMNEYHFVADYCIGTNDYVDSVFIFSDKPIQEIKSLRLDKQSKTSNGLAQILLKKLWKVDVQVLHEGDADAYVLIGDRTFGKKDEVPYAYDLGHYWKQLTGLPFAFAVWVSNKELPLSFTQKFNQALADGVANPEAVLGELPAIPNFDYQYYLTKNLDFHLTAEKLKAISLYLEWYKEL
ncbi:menaquinone biosynthetic enzyme MqnA/MqnD family protein [Sphingobacterium sp. HJSM2_6]|uniref:menaquinone biosynthetic enzyme MqnA/MqnD family protein n=1 Tax=Sphingobacterium sp. HJSM2_6 TaxID=3366264 RepID=UPI003BDEE35A